MAPTTRTCSLLALALLGFGSASAASAARVDLPTSNATTFVGARAAELSGDPRRAAVLYASLAESDPEVQNIIDKETWRQFSGLELIASEVRHPKSATATPYT